MKNGIFAFVILIGLLNIGNAAARCTGSVINGKCYGVVVPGSDDSKARYSGQSGTQYQYDMSNPIDRVRYSTDISAQQRDLMNTNPRSGLDRSLGQYGGGILND